MKSVLVGNGININFGGKAYSNDFIIKRIIFNALDGKYDQPLFGGKFDGKGASGLFNGLKDTANDVLIGKYDGLGDPDESAAIADFKRRYTPPLKRYYEVMLEDWFLLLRLFFISNKDLENLTRSAKQGFEQLILDGIYNEGDIQRIYSGMKRNVKRYFSEFDNIFTLNYDNNLENLTGKKVYHLHGDYQVLADSEDPITVQGFIQKKRGNTFPIPEGFSHCHCNALLDYSGALKYKHAHAIMELAREYERYRELYRDNGHEYLLQLAQMLLRDENAAEYFAAYAQNASLTPGSDYHFAEFDELEGELHIIGMSPNNDSHIFNRINESNLSKVYFYCYTPINLSDLPVTKPVELKDVTELWRRLDALKPVYNSRYPIPSDPRIDQFIEVFNTLSGDPMTRKEIIDAANAIPLFEANRLCEEIKSKIDGREPPKSEEELMHEIRIISNIGLRKGVLPSALYLLFIMYLSRIDSVSAKKRS